MDKSRNLPIGIFDSGVGGLTIWKEIHQLLPHESTIYLADNKNAPYGSKTKEQIIDLSLKNTDYLVNKGVKLIVVACNTATTNAIHILRSKYTVPIIGTEPAIKPAIKQTKTNSIGILATKGTLESTKYQQSKTLYPDIQFNEQIGYNLVQLIEQNKINSLEIIQNLENYLTPMLKQNIDCLVLGCTHYPLLTDKIKQIIPNHISILDSGFPIAKHIKSVLQEQQLLADSSKQPTFDFFANASTTVMEQLITLENSNIALKDF